MKKEDIIKMAKEAGLDPDLWNYTDEFEHFAALVAAAEREACAMVAEQWPYEDERMFSIAQAIRARGEQ